ncbi:BCCT family transporter [Saccharomonospora sp. CUA-673]|uniref:BCCT family transporter n=1 Tax=Saccharomonospora sp. CUA-673 TaxID=1904969 RepID=UPI0035143D7B
MAPRIFWALATGVLTAAMLMLGGVPVLQSATIIMALPFSIVVVLVMIGLYRALRVDTLRTEASRQNLRGWLSGRTSADAPGPAPWRLRLNRALSLPDADAARRYVDTIGVPALEELAGELRGQDVSASTRRTVDDRGEECVELTTDLDCEHPFRYRLCVREVPVPAYAQASEPERETYAQVEVHLDEGGQGYDVMDYSHAQLIDDVVDQYERHLEFLRLR